MNLAWKDWVQRRVELRAVRAGRVGLEQCVTSLLDQSAQDIAVLVAMAAAIRLRLREAGHLPDDVLHIAGHREYEQITVRHRIARLVRRHQRRSEYIEAASAMIWVHTLRALVTPQLHELAVQMWRQLQRGIPLAGAAVEKIAAATGQALPNGTLQACEFIPEDFWQPVYEDPVHH